MFLVLALLLLLFLPYPWNLATALASALVGAVEVLYWERRMRRRPVRTGVEDLIGATGEVTTRLAPDGQIRLKGELWDAHSPTPVDRGGRVRVIGIEDLRLEVRPAETTPKGSSAALLVIVLALAGCGGDDEPSASEQYADEVCGSLNTWAIDVESTVRSLADAGLSLQRDDVERAVEDVRGSTEQLADDLEEAGLPETEAGNEAKSELDELASSLSEQVDAVERALDSGESVAGITATVTGAISTAVTAVETTFQELQNLDAADELEEAFRNSDECDELRDQLERNSS